MPKADNMVKELIKNVTQEVMQEKNQEMILQILSILSVQTPLIDANKQSLKLDLKNISNSQSTYLKLLDVIEDKYA